MKMKKIISIILAALTLVFMLASCGGDGNTPADTTTEAPDVTITVSVTVKDYDGEVKYEVPEYKYTGASPTPITVLDFAMDIELDVTIVKDDSGDIISIGDISKEGITETNAEGVESEVEGLYWWYTVNGKKIDKGMDEYTLADGDKLEFYLVKASIS